MGRKSQFGSDRICAVVAAHTAREMVQQLRRALKLTRTVELRLDYLKGQSLSRFLAWILRTHPAATLIATCRRKQSGGLYGGDFHDQLAVLRHASCAGFSWCDVDLQTLEHLQSKFRKFALSRMIGLARGLVSYHDFKGLPSRLSGIVQRIDGFGGDAAKIAVQCRSIRDSRQVLDLAKSRQRIVVVPMGELGLPARILALRHGSALAYAPVEQSTAPGQVSLEEMKNLYRADRLDGRTRVYGVIGDPVRHSLSPLLHNTGFIARRVNAVYLPFLVRDLRDFLDAVEPLGIRGFSVTLPHKERVLRHLDDCDPLAGAIGAVNTVVVRGGGKLYGYNTDYVGVLRALERRVSLRGSRVLIYGAGGAARAVAFALAHGGAVVSLCARRKERARALARAVGGEVISRHKLRSEFFDAIVNTTPVGMHPRAEASPLEAAELNCRLVMDLVYRPMKTRLLRLAERRGIETVSGVEMFLAQGIAQWEIWTGERALEAPMRRAVARALRREERFKRK